MDGSKPLRPRLEAFVRYVSEGLSLSESWALSAKAVDKQPGSIESNRVSGSRANARPEVQERIAFLKLQNAQDVPEQAVTASTLTDLMTEVSATLVLAINRCERIGETTLSQRLRNTLLQHVSRNTRASRKIGDVAVSMVQIDSTEMLERLQR